ncbi:potassium transporter peripheral membrane component [Mycoplasmopsis arginini]|nr:potassium transporter peripheral membrane component [Chlamydia abortus]SGA05612.1 potassium transporter peripheral membrane component [Mycoplasmopsis arginini]SGA11085.1 potassium transporter peripheral membrane component [Mycoplasmopsis arginini]SGA32219.1 potassium transporter peripheral membrane component [Chlamydia abortus]
MSSTVYIKNSEIIGKKISDTAFRSKYEVLVSLIQRDEKFFLPSGDFEIKEDDLITFIGKLEDIIKVTEFCTRINNKK